MTSSVGPRYTPSVSAFESTASPLPAKGADKRAAQELGARPAAVKPAAGAFRTSGPKAMEVRAAMTAMLSRAASVKVSIEGHTVQEFVRKYIIDNPRVSNAQILAMSKVPLSEFATTPEQRARVLESFPNARALPSHQFAIGLMHAVTGLDAKQLSKYLPDAGLTGPVAGQGWGWAPMSPRESLSTALHDFTDYLSTLPNHPVDLDLAVWGTSSTTLSALESYFLGVPD